MTVTSRLTQSQRQNLGFRQIQAVNLLRLSNEELTSELMRRAAANPFLRLRLPAPPATADQADEAGGLWAHVTGQLRMIRAARADEALALAFVEALDGNGWLDRPVAEIAVAANRAVAAAEAMLTALQQEIEPVGLFARNLADCLRLQAADQGRLTPAMEAVLHHLDLVVTGGAGAVARAAGCSVDEVARCLAQIQRMAPRPGRAFGGDAAVIRAPDVIVSRGPGGWQIALNRATLPGVSLAPRDGAMTRAVRAEAEWLVTIVERRNRTILAVAQAVMQRQRGFLEQGAGALIALSRAEIAAGLGLHGSTVGRVARGLLVETPHGIRTLCSFFYSGPAKSGIQGTLPAAAAIRHRLSQLIATEDPVAPLSDAALAAKISASGTPLARRTVAKYRDALGIPIHRLRTGK